MFLSQELTTTGETVQMEILSQLTSEIFSVVTSARLRSIKASREMIREVSSSTGGAVSVPRHRLSMSLESLARSVGGGWSLSGLGGLGEGVSLVKAANGQVYRMSVTDSVRDDDHKTEDSMEVDNSDSGLGAFHPDSLDTIASVNHWRCSGFPLYGQVL